MYWDSHNFEPKGAFRDLKIRMITEDIKFDISDSIFIDKKFLKKFIDFVCEQYPDTIISGSVALSLYGLLNRPIGDIDLIITERPNLALYNNYYGDEDIEDSPTKRLGYAYIKEKFKFKHLFKDRNIFNVDFFIDIDNKVKYKEFTIANKTIKVQDPIQIIEQKVGMLKENSSSKHKTDLYFLFRSIK